MFLKFAANFMESKSLPARSAQISRARYCCLASSIAPSLELEAACDGKECRDPNFHAARNDFPCFGLEFVSNSAGNLFLDGRRYPLHVGVLFCGGPGTRHRIVSHAADLLAGICLSVKAAIEVGHADPYHFSRIIKKSFGCAPARFPERHWRLQDSFPPPDPAS